MLKEQSITMQMIASAAGVSPSTVCLVLNGTGTIGNDTRERVRQAAASLGYVSHKRRLPRGKAYPETRRIELLWFNTNKMWTYSRNYDLLLDSLNRACREAHFRLSVSHLVTGDHLPHEFWRGVSGVILAGQPPESLPGEIPQEVSVIQMHSDLESTSWSTVHFDNVTAGFEIATFLLKSGHRRIAFVTPEADHPCFRMRQSGFRLAHDKFGVEIDPVLFVTGQQNPVAPRRQEADSWSIEEGLRRLFS